MRESHSFGSKKSSKERQKKWYNDDTELIKGIFGGLTIVGSIIYYCVLGFTVFDSTDESEDYLKR